MRFIVDGMLGGLARWLRILGHDVWYERSQDDTTILKTAIDDNRILLTGDKELYERALSKHAPTLLIVGLREENRLAEVAKRFSVSLDPDMTVSRCPECSSELEEVERNEVANSVPATSLRLYNQFWQCKNPTCGKVYWMGSHWRQITKTLEQAKKLTKGSSNA